MPPKKRSSDSEQVELSERIVQVSSLRLCLHVSMENHYRGVPCNLYIAPLFEHVVKSGAKGTLILRKTRVEFHTTVLCYVFHEERLQPKARIRETFLWPTVGLSRALLIAMFYKSHFFNSLSLVIR